MNFLESVAKYYFQKSDGDFQQIQFVFPSHRAAVFFTKYIRALITDRPIFGLKILTINELFAKHSNLTVADNITLMFELYKAYCKVYKNEKNEVKSFDEFLPWAKMFLGDFDDIDKYMIEAKQLFINMKEYHDLKDNYEHLTQNQIDAIEAFWGTFNVERLSQHQQIFLQTWEHLNDFYLEFNKQLNDSQLTYAGALSRKIANEVVAEKIDIEGRYAFIGFNALTAAEQQIMSYLQKNNRADFFWDYSDFMLNNNSCGPDHGPARFIKQNILNFKMPSDYHLPAAELSPEIQITELSYSVGQAAQAADFLKRQYTGNDKTAIVLTDENMLLPVLYALPDNVDKVNVTMGYPLKNSQAYGLLDAIFALQMQSSLRNGVDSFYHKTVLAILRHPNIVSIDNDAAKKIIDDILKRNLIVVSAPLLSKNELFKLIFKRISSKDDVTKYLTDIYEYIFANLDKDAALQREFVFAMLKSLKRFSDLMPKIDIPEFEITTWFKLFRSIAEMQSVDFVGEPLSGLQLMGILETRAIDFDKLVVLDMNEGVFPKTTPANSFIPYVLRKGFGLPTIEFQDSIFSYYFFRLISRAKNVELLYSTSEGGKCMSRFLYQLIYEYNAKPSQRVAVQSINLFNNRFKEIKKDALIQENLSRFVKDDAASSTSFLSPSSLSMYIECPMRFCFAKVLRIAEVQDVSEDADARTFGKIFHYVMENLYKPFVDQEITEDTIKVLLNNKTLIDNLMYAAFKEVLNIDRSQIQGKNTLIFDVIRRYIIRLLAYGEKENLPFVFKAAEYEVNDTITISSGKQIKIGGIVDRIHEKNNSLCVVDYKTGSAKGKKSFSSFTDIDSLFDQKVHHDVKPVFQTMLYCMLLESKSYSQLPLKPNVLWMTKLFKDDFSMNVVDKTKSQITYSASEESVEYKKLLLQLVEEIFDPSIPFRKTECTDNCSFCNYANMCGL